MKVLIAIDSSISSHHALEQALLLLNLQKACFLLLSVEEIVAAPSMIASSPFGIMTENTNYNIYDEIELTHQQEKRNLTALDWAREFCTKFDIESQSILEIGDPKHIICQVAQREKPDLIVVGSEGRGILERALLGSISDYVLHHTHFPVLVIRND